MDDKEDKVKAFKRLMKELNVYNAWLNYRKSYLKAINSPSSMYKAIYEAQNAAHAISCSFIWSCKYYGDFWCELHNILNEYNFKLELSEITTKQNGMKALKIIVKKHFK